MESYINNEESIVTDEDKERIAWLKHRIEYDGRYHDHKESMAWVATALYVPGIIVLALETQEMASSCDWNRGLLISSFIISGLLITGFVKWQFEKRWIAHSRVWNCVRYLEDEVLQAKETPFPRNEKIERERHHYWDAFVDLCCCCRKHKRLCSQLEPIKSEVITYLAIDFVTLAAILIVGLAGVRCWHCG